MQTGQVCDRTPTPTGQDITSHAPSITRVWAPDTVIAQFGGSFTPYHRCIDLPLSVQAIPGVTSWAGVLLWFWWSADWWDEPGVLLRCPLLSRRAVVWTVLLIGERLDDHEELGGIPPEVWLLILGFVRHDAPPTLAVN